jgi:hypothetical protein
LPDGHKNEQNTNETSNLSVEEFRALHALSFSISIYATSYNWISENCTILQNHLHELFRSVADETLAQFRHGLADHFNFTPNYIVAKFHAF